MAIPRIPVILPMSVFEQVGDIERMEGKTPVETVPYLAIWVQIAFQNRNTNGSIGNGNFSSRVIFLHFAVKIAAREQEPESLVGRAHPVKLEPGLSCLRRGAGYAIGVEHNKNRLMVSIGNPTRDDFLPTIIIQVSQGEVEKMTGMPIFRDRLAVGINKGYLRWISGTVIASNHDRAAIPFAGLRTANQLARKVAGSF